MSMQYDNYNLCFDDMQFIEVNARTCQQKRTWYYEGKLCLTNYAHDWLSVLDNFGGIGEIIRLSQWQWTIPEKNGRVFYTIKQNLVILSQ